MAAGVTATRVAIEAVLLLLCSIFLRILYIHPLTRRRRRVTSPHHRTTPAHLLIVLGSGGHTAELLSILRDLDPTKYSPRTYIVSSGDALGVSKATEFERRLAAQTIAAGRKGYSPHVGLFEVVTVPRARRIHQSLLTTPLSALQCLIACILLLARKIKIFAAMGTATGTATAGITSSPDLIITNGPATGVIVILAALLVRFLGLQKGGEMATIYVESWARVRSLSLSGKLLRGLGLTNRFLVQWPALESEMAEYRGALVE